MVVVQFRGGLVVHTRMNVEESKWRNWEREGRLAKKKKKDYRPIRTRHVKFYPYQQVAH